ncbi:S-adenosyl-L-methionine-dependent methyltransferase [Punctularia strigosozonata HHB-11173 SS5]|uniref:S-adenosyl-L-methionine-dependent methyltransferase n=1 Tax=Punctularia strigosozonata (strain HHB-11173) TaxID=741275 RepID=UPI0004416665|nr:S-adenosyl-L-methionine-dependent methyltransferase [Punctularia strigosozonata HHB-11173 SS5]EIN09261.1 S-adenosyl-L-methionine-dependent methyltransferase [Punctularia strigosozonata HHB-11173 SS5]
MPKRKGRGKGGSRDAVGHIEKSDMQNARMEKYYRTQKIVPDNEWDQLWEAMRVPLPTTFRVAGSRQAAQVLNETIKTTHTPQLKGVEFEGQELPPPVQLPWYPDGLAWQFNAHKSALRKQPEFKKFHSFLVFETEVGNISRQEAVSMIPPLLLDVQPHHRVIDMCAAPGSKTAQLLEALHAHDTLTSSSTPTGLLIANDSDNKRAHMLIHQSARLPSPSLMVTNLDASIYPVIRVGAAEDDFVGHTRAEKKKAGVLAFDRILCDVPCSGDGTMRKNPAIWKRWSPMDGNGLHSLQLRILQRAMRMLKDGGRIVYSTCSLNPVENEAVVSAALQSVPDYELIDVSDRLPGLIRRPGLSTWTPSSDRECNTSFPTYSSYIDSLSEENRKQTKMSEGQWPPPEGVNLKLERCIRIYPHLQDTGGFFVAVLEKKVKQADEKGSDAEDAASLGKRPAGSPVPVPQSEAKKPRISSEEVSSLSGAEAGDNKKLDEEVTVSSDTASKPAEVKQKGKPESESGGGSFKEPPYTFLSADDPVVQTFTDQLHLTSNFPASNVLVRNPVGDAIRAIYLSNNIGRSIIENNDYTRLRLLTCGTKLFVKQGAEKSPDTQFRILCEGLPAVMPYIKPETILDGDLGTLKVLMSDYYPLCSTLPQSFRAKIDDEPNGNYIVRFPPEHAEGGTITHNLILPIWKSNFSVCLMIEKKAKSALSLRVFGEDLTTAARMANEKKAKQPAEEKPLSTNEPKDDGADTGDVENGKDMEMVVDA